VSGPWGKYVEQAAEAGWNSNLPTYWQDEAGCWEPMPTWSQAGDADRLPTRELMRAALAAVGPLIQEDARERMVAAAGAALEREGVVDLKPLVCPHCGGELFVETEPTGGYYSEDRVDRIECCSFECAATWDRSGVALLKPRKLCGTCETSQRTADDMGGKVPSHEKVWGGKCPGDPS
jgi:hypothetical protein